MRHVTDHMTNRRSAQTVKCSSLCFCLSSEKHGLGIQTKSVLQLGAGYCPSKYSLFCQPHTITMLDDMCCDASEAGERGTSCMKAKEDNFSCFRNCKMLNLQSLFAYEVFLIFIITLIWHVALLWSVRRSSWMLDKICYQLVQCSTGRWLVVLLCGATMQPLHLHALAVDVM